MTYRNYRNSLNRLMLSYLRFMKHADTDQQLLELHAEVGELRTKIHNLDQFTASQMQEQVVFKEETFESFGFPTIVIPEFERKSVLHRKEKTPRGVKKPKSKYTGVSWDSRNGNYKASVMYKGRNFLCAYFKTEDEAVKQRDITIIKYHLPFPLQLLKKSDKP